MEFKLHTEQGEVQPCDSCNFPVPTAEFDWPVGLQYTPTTPKRLLCEFCCTTMASRYTEYPARDEHQALRQEIWKAAAAVYNMQKFGDIL